VHIIISTNNCIEGLLVAGLGRAMAKTILPASGKTGKLQKTWQKLQISYFLSSFQHYIYISFCIISGVV